MGPEAGLRARVLRAIRHTPGTQCWGWPASAFTGAGHPDLFGVACSRFFALELKTATGRTTQRQELAIRGIRRAGGYAWVIRTVEQAQQAVAYVIEGKHPPMANDPLDIEDFFKSLDAAGTVTETESLPWDAALATPDPPAREAAAEAAFIIEETQPEPTHEEILADLDARSDALNGTLPSVEEMMAVADAAREPLPAFTDEQLFIEATQKMATFAQKLDQDLRTVGDRVTMVVEEGVSMRLELTVMRNQITALEKAVRALTALISDEDPAPDPEPEPEPEPAPEPDPVPAPTARRTSRRRA